MGTLFHALPYCDFKDVTLVSNCKLIDIVRYCAIFPYFLTFRNSRVKQSRYYIVFFKLTVFRKLNEPIGYICHLPRCITTLK
mgnify:CR=1 FL=1